MAKQDFVIYEMLKNLNISMESVIDGSIDFDSVKSQFDGISKLPNRYLQKTQASQRLTSIYILDYISKYQGVASRDLLMQHFQLSDADIQNTMDKNNIRLPNDICNYIYRHSGEEVVKEMGGHSINFLKKTSVGGELSRCKSTKVLLELFIVDVVPNIVEKNFSWNISNISIDQCTVRGRPNQDILNESLPSQLNMRALEIFREGFLSKIPSLIGIENVLIKQLKSVSSGHQEDVYQLYYPSRIVNKALLH
jgi:hypothetical protein